MGCVVTIDASAKTTIEISDGRDASPTPPPAPAAIAATPTVPPAPTAATAPPKAEGGGMVTGEKGVGGEAGAALEYDGVILPPPNATLTAPRKAGGRVTRHGSVRGTGGTTMYFNDFVVAVDDVDAAYWPAQKDEGHIPLGPPRPLAAAAVRGVVGCPGAVVSIAVRGGTFAVASEGGKQGGGVLKYGSIRGGKVLGWREMRAPSSMRVLCISGDGNEMALCVEERHVQVWKVLPVRRICEYSRRGSNPLCGTFVGGSSHILVVGDQRGVYQRLQLQTGECAASTGVGVPLTCMSAYSDGGVLVCGYGDGKLRLHSVAAGVCVPFQTALSHEGSVRCVHVMPHDRRILSNDAYGCRVWCGVTGELLYKLSRGAFLPTPTHTMCDLTRTCPLAHDDVGFAVGTTARQLIVVHLGCVGRDGLSSVDLRGPLTELACDPQGRGGAILAGDSEGNVVAVPI